jgi:hypothetical protein
MVAFLIVLVLLYSWASKPQSWRWLESSAESTALASEQDENRARGAPGPNASGKDSAADVVVPGTTDQNEAEAASAHSLFEAVTDREPLAKIEMPAYWRCLKWARAQSFADLESRALKNVVYTQFWQQPEKYRGKVVRLRLHVHRILNWEAGENSAGVRQAYEVWGNTDESKSHPYVVVLSELPNGIPLGDGVHEEGLFVGYFLKTLAYTAFNKNRSAPLLLGRMKWLSAAATAPPVVGRKDWFWIAVVGVPVVLLIAIGTWYQIRRAGQAHLPPVAPTDEAEMESWFGSGAASSSDEPARDLPAG